MTAGRYLLLDRVGMGGMAEVFRAKAFGVAGFEKIVAIKRIRPDLAANQPFVEGFVNEARVAGELQHDNIVQIFELGRLQGTHFIAMEYVFGKDLLQLLSSLKHGKQVMAPQMAAWIMAKVLAGLHYAHTKAAPDGRPLGLIHRDLSPQNILISYDGSVKLIDFGIALAPGRSHHGKVGYMSPEQLMGGPIDHRSDVFAASTCLHEMLTCRRLFRAPTNKDTSHRVCTGDVPRPSSINPNVPPDLEAIVMRGLALRPEDRWQTAGQMEAALIKAISRSELAFETAELRLVMHAIFTQEIEQEWTHLSELQRIVQPGIKVLPTEQATTQPDILAIEKAPLSGNTLVAGGMGAPSAALPVDTILSAAPSNGADSMSRVVAVEAIISVGGPPTPQPAEPEPFLLEAHPSTQPPEPPPAEFMPDSSMAFPLVANAGTFDLRDTADDFDRPFLGSNRVASESMVAVPVPGGSIPDLPAMIAPPPPSTPLPPAVTSPTATGQSSWLMLGLTATVALLVGAGGVLIALYALGVLPPS